MRNRCPFCDRREFEERLIFESSSFTIIATKGQIFEGYVLIFPKRHTICFGELTEEEMEEFAGLKLRARSAVRRAYGQEPIVFEHGVVGQSVKHAHMHIVPTSADLFPRIASDFPDYQSITSLGALQETFQREGPYLYYENQESQTFLFHIFKWPQYLRVVLAEAVGRPERADWRKMDKILDQSLYFETRRKISAAFND